MKEQKPISETTSVKSPAVEAQAALDRLHSGDKKQRIVACHECRDVIEHLAEHVLVLDAIARKALARAGYGPSEIDRYLALHTEDAQASDSKESGFSRGEQGE